MENYFYKYKELIKSFDNKILNDKSFTIEYYDGYKSYCFNEKIIFVFCENKEYLDICNKTIFNLIFNDKYKLQDFCNVIDKNFGGLIFNYEDIQKILKVSFYPNNIKIITVDKYGERLTGINKINAVTIFGNSPINKNYIKAVKTLWMNRKLKRTLAINKNESKKQLIKI